MSKHKVLITGGASGLGKALAEQYAERGSQLWLLDINAEMLEVTAEALRDNGASVHTSVCDITNQDHIEQVKQALEQQWQGLDCLINNAGIASGGLLHWDDIDQWRTVFDINVLGMVRMTQAFVDLLRQSQGTIINVASQAGLTPIPMMGSYNASKAAVVSFSETMAVELSKDNIQVSVVCPVFFATNLDKSLLSKQPGIAETVSKLLKNSPKTAAEVANYVVEKAGQGKYLIQPHRIGRKTYWMKRLMPRNSYLNAVRKQTRKLMKKALSNEQQHGR